jgi:DNA helicase HerA-like ATPase
MDGTNAISPEGEDKGSGAPPPAAAAWDSIGRVVGSASTSSYSFILRNMKAKVGDIVATRLDVPTGSAGGEAKAVVWGRIVAIQRFNPFFPSEAAQELAHHDVRLLDTVLSESRDHLEAEVLILGTTRDDGSKAPRMSPLTYPVKPSAEVLYPPAESVRGLLTGDADPRREHKLHIGSLIARNDVEVSLGARQVVSRHLAILAMTGGGKTVAARRIISQLIGLRYPLVIFDPHGDYLGFQERQADFPGLTVKVFYPVIQVTPANVGVIGDLVEKMGQRLSGPQQEFFNHILSVVEPPPAGEPAITYIDRLIDKAVDTKERKRNKEADAEVASIGGATMHAVIRSLKFVRENLLQMERNNQRLRDQPGFRKAGIRFTPMPSPTDAPEEIVRPGQVSIFYLAGFDHLNQSAIVSLVMEALFLHRAKMQDIIPPFQAVVEEAHNFIPSRQEGTDATPSLPTLRKVITEGRKFGTGLIIISQRPSRLDETTLSQCNSFLVLRLVNPKDKSFVRSVMENLTEQDANVLQTFGPGQGIVSGQAVAFPLLVQVQDDQLRTSAITDEDFINVAQNWRPDPTRAADDEAMADEEEGDEEPAAAPRHRTSGAKAGTDGPTRPAKKPIKLKTSRRPPPRR